MPLPNPNSVSQIGLARQHEDGLGHTYHEDACTQHQRRVGTHAQHEGNDGEDGGPGHGDTFAETGRQQGRRNIVGQRP